MFAPMCCTVVVIKDKHYFIDEDGSPKGKFLRSISTNSRSSRVSKIMIIVSYFVDVGPQYWRSQKFSLWTGSMAESGH